MKKLDTNKLHNLVGQNVFVCDYDISTGTHVPRTVKLLSVRLLGTAWGEVDATDLYSKVNTTNRGKQLYECQVVRSDGQKFKFTSDGIFTKNQEAKIRCNMLNFLKSLINGEEEEPDPADWWKK